MNGRAVNKLLYNKRFFTEQGWKFSFEVDPCNLHYLSIQFFVQGTKVFAWKLLHEQEAAKNTELFSAPPSQLGGRPVRLKCNWALQIFSIASWTKHYCNDFFWIAIKFLHTAHVKADLLISHQWINIQVSHPPGIPVTMSRICHAWVWHLSWQGSAGNLKWDWAANDNVQNVYSAVLVHCADPGEGW